ncbi:hypothetical protein GCM10022402_29960 [Salinactinospora qingdaonensis]|uniref:Uncharacterized protein n=1 Tax=Salinactinospora qingdaonensis TaxID=702744 RepID=A0ABP7FVV6_9ACTN
MLAVYNLFALPTNGVGREQTRASKKFRELWDGARRRPSGGAGAPGAALTAEGVGGAPQRWAACWCRV